MPAPSSAPSFRPVVSDDPARARAAIRAAVLQDERLVLLDRATAQGDGWLETAWRVPTAEQAPWLFRGDAGGRLLPGTLTTEHVVQSGELLIHAQRGPTTAAEGVPVLARLERVRCRGMVRPGDHLATRVELTDVVGPAYHVRARVRRGDEVVLEARLAFAATTAVAQAAP